MTRRTLALIGGVGAAAIIAVAGVALARDSRADAISSTARPELASYGSASSAAGVTTRGGMGGKMQELMANDEFRAELGTLRDTHQAAMDAWWDKYGGDPRSSEAVAALRTLRDEQRTAMNALLEKYGVDTGAREQARQTADHARAQLEELMSNDAFRADLNELRNNHEAAVDAWWDKYADAPRSDGAAAARKELRDTAQKDVEALLKKYDVTNTTGARGLLGLLGGGMMSRGGFGGGMMDGGHGGMHRGGDTDAPSSATSPAASQIF